jgi:ABC-type sugar transport system ATPase subunit
VTVLRDGALVSAVDRARTEPAQVVRWMVGREIAEMAFDDHSVEGKALLQVEGLSLPSPPDSGRPALEDLRFEVRAGEVLGIAGLLGAGRTELLEALFGATSVAPSGRIVLDGRSVHFRNPAAAIAAGVALVTEDRKSLGLFDQMTVAENITICHLDDLAVAGVIDRRAESRAVRELDRSARGQDPRRWRLDHEPLRGQPAEMHPRPLAARGARRSSCSTSRPGASTSAPRPRSTS